MKIREKLLRVHVAVILDKIQGGGMLAGDIGQSAVKAITKGLGSDEWKEYMALFADSADQLKRLTTDASDGANSWLPHARAYIVSNAVCAAATDIATHKGLDEIGDIDAGNLNETPDPAVAALRKIVVPNV